MRKLGAIFTLCLFLISSVAGVVSAADGDRTYPIMRPDRETLEKWIEAYNSAPLAYMDTEGVRVPSPTGSLNLLDHLDYNPGERDQGNCNNCWAWAGTGCLGIALSDQEGIKDRLSVQYINSCQTNVTGKPCCQGGWLYNVTDFYDPVTGYDNSTDGVGQCIPWSNSYAHWQDGDGSCDTDCENISTTPNYPIACIQEEAVPTQGVGNATAIANIKNVLDQNKGVWFGFFVPTEDDWGDFCSFWSSSGEDVVYDMDQFCGVPYDFGGHAVLCVGYNDDDPGNRYWIMLNSWGTTTDRPNGLFRINMDMNYDCTNPGLPFGGYSFYWQTLDVAFAGMPDISVPPTDFNVTLPPDTTQDYWLTINNDGNAALGYNISDWETTGVIARAGVGTPALPAGQPGREIGLIELSSSEPISFAAPPPLAGTAEEIAYDDGEADDAWSWYIAGGEFAVRFTPPSYPVSLETARICLWPGPPDWPDSDHEAFAVEVYNDDGAGGAPGTLVGSVNTTASDWGWWDVDISGLGITVIGGDFYVAYKQLTYGPDSEGLCADTTDPDGRSWLWSHLTWFPVEGTLTGAIDWMIRCVVEPCVVELSDCPWLSESPISGTVGPGGSQNITISINTTGLGSDYSAEIVIASNDPDEEPVIVPVTLHVSVQPPNHPPYVPYNPSPANHATSSCAVTDLRWWGEDPDAWDTVTYDVYFGTNSTPPLVSSNQTGTRYEPGTLAYNTTYYWRIVATDNHQSSTAGPVWDFTTYEMTDVVVSIPDAATLPDGSVQVPININNVTDLGAVDIRLHYDATVVNVTAVANGDLTGGMYLFNNDTANATCKMGWFTFYLAGQTGDFVLAYVTLHAVGNPGDTSDLELMVWRLVDYDANPICHSVDDGVFSIGSLMEGDATLDGYVDIVDAMFIGQHVFGLRPFTADQLKCGDTTDDEVVDIVDAMHTAQWVFGVALTPLWESPADDDMLPPVPHPAIRYSTFMFPHVEDRAFAVDYPSDWAEDSARKAERHSYFDEVSMAGYTLDGGCYAFFVSPASNAYLEVAMHDLPLPVTVDMVLPAAPWDEMFPGFVEPDEWTEIDPMNAIGEFSCDEGQGKILVSVKVLPQQVWYVTCMAEEEAFDGYEPTFDHILDSFTFLT